MICYINHKLDTQLKLCTLPYYDELINSAAVAGLIADYRNGNAAAKAQLPAFLFQGYDPNLLLGKKGSRKASHLQPTGLFMMDFDHVDSPREVYDTFLKKLPSLGFTLERDLALAHITPSGKGLRLVLRTPQGMTIETAQHWVAKVMEVPCDEVVKDLSRLSFVPQKSDILYKNYALLFGDAPKSIDNNEQRGTAADVSRGNERSCAASAAGDAGERGEPHRGGASQHEGSCAADAFPAVFTIDGVAIPYKRIVDELISLYGGTPAIGNRNNVLFKIVNDVAKITDYSPVWIEQLVPDFGLPEDEWRQCIATHSKASIGKGWTKKLAEAVARCKQEAIARRKAQAEAMPDDEKVAKGYAPPPMPLRLPPLVKHLVKNVMPFQRPATAMALFPALAAHVSNALFELADGSDTELSLMCVVLGQQSVGKSCINKPLRCIMKDIEEEDEVNRARERNWADEAQTRKASEKGKAKPKDLVVRFLGADTTPAAFLGRLFAAERAGHDARQEWTNYCCYSQVAEIEDLYNFCSSQRAQVTQMIRHAYDRDVISSERWTANAANFRTVLRWNWCASSTFHNGRKFFKNSLTDGTTSRIDFAVMLPPSAGVEFRYGRYDSQFDDELRPFIERLKEYKSLRDSRGDIVPTAIPEVLDLERRLNDHIREQALDEATDTYANYAWRAKVNALKKAIVLWIAAGCKWDDEIEQFTWWMYEYAMWCKMQLFAQKADEAFAETQFVGTDRGHKSPLKKMKRVFTAEEFAVAVREMGCRSTPAQRLADYVHRGYVTRDGDNYIINAEYCKRNNIPLDIPKP